MQLQNHANENVPKKGSGPSSGKGPDRIAQMHYWYIYIYMNNIYSQVLECTIKCMSDIYIYMTKFYPKVL